MTPAHECPRCGIPYCVAHEESVRQAHDVYELAAVIARAMHEAFVAAMLKDGRMMIWTQTWAETMPSNRHEWERN